MITADKNAAYNLLVDGSLIDFEILDSSVDSSPDKGNIAVCIELVFKDEDESEPEEIVEWGAFGFMFALAVLSFADARPRGISIHEYDDKDEFTIADFHQCLTYNKKGLHFNADYLCGRCLKTSITVRPNGTVRLRTRNRGETPLRWLDKLKGKKKLELL
jgi:hypothetical protein